VHLAFPLERGIHPFENAEAEAFILRSGHGLNQGIERRRGGGICPPGRRGREEGERRETPGSSTEGANHG
jgi:hypothetical protein